jgi:hypothetical protein
MATGELLQCYTLSAASSPVDCRILVSPTDRGVSRVCNLSSLDPARSILLDSNSGQMLLNHSDGQDADEKTDTKHP